MLSWNLSQIAEVVNGRLEGGSQVVRGISTDSRMTQPGKLFVALRGPRHNGHDFVEEAVSHGASAALIEESRSFPVPTVRVEATRAALLKLAAEWRRNFTLPLGAVAGSNGKTTVKDMTARILAQLGPVLATDGNQNNEVGIPLNLARLGSEHRHAVIEIGINRRGEMKILADAVAPTAAVVTSIGEEHLEGLGDLDTIAREEGMVYASLPPDGIAVVDAESPWLDEWTRSMVTRRRLLFGMRSGDVRPSEAPLLDQHGSHFELCLPEGRANVTLHLLGLPAVHNAIAAAALATALGATPGAIERGLRDMRPTRHRLEPRPLSGGTTLLDDTYNANPPSLMAALEVSQLWPAERWCVLGSMGELGAASSEWHQRAGVMIRHAGFERLYVIGDEARRAADAFGSGAVVVGNRAELTERLKAELMTHGPALLLVKGSRAMHLDEVSEALAPSASSGGHP